MSPVGAARPQKAAPTPALAADTDVPICLDFLKGRCTRSQCRFLHPDLSQYEQLSGAVHARAGRRVCEVWAMTGQCKFGAKCNRLHPSVVVSQPPQQLQPTMTMLLPLAAVPQPVALLEAPVAPPALPQPLQPAHLLDWPVGFPAAGPPVSVGRPVAAGQPPAWAAIPTTGPSGLQRRHLKPVSAPPSFPPQTLAQAPSIVLQPRPRHVTVPADTAEPQDEFQQLVRSILLMNLRKKPSYPRQAVASQEQSNLSFGDSRQSSTDVDTTYCQMEQPAVPNPQHPATPQNSQFPLNRLLLEVLRDLQGKYVQSA